MDSKLSEARYPESNALYKRAKESVPAQCHTLSHGPTQYVSGASPRFLDRGDGCYVWDVDGNRFLDLAPGGFPAVLGYNNREFNAAIEEQLRKGLLFPMPSSLEVQAAEKIIDCVPCAERVKFAKNGSDVTTMAVRLARAITGRTMVAAGGYHGFHDWFIGTTNRIQGIPEEVRRLTLTFAYNDLESLERIFTAHPGEVAAVIMEPVQLSAPVPGYLEQVKALSHRNGALLVFDEIITGFRFNLGGAQAYFGVTPDLATLGKAMGNGMPISALVGKKEYMDEFSFEGVFFSSTFGGECASLAAVIRTIDLLQKYDVIAHIWKVGAKLRDGFNDAAKRIGIHRYLECHGYAPWTDIEVYPCELGVSDLELKSLFQQECMKLGILAGLYHAPCYAHKDEDINLALCLYEKAMLSVRAMLEDGQILAKLEGEPIRPVFRKKA